MESISTRLQNPLFKPILLFLSFILPSMDRFNRMFQKSDENTSQLYDEMSRLTRLYASNFLKRVVISAVHDDISRLDENLGIGNNTWAAVAELELEHDTKPFILFCRKKVLRSVFEEDAQEVFL